MKLLPLIAAPAAAAATFMTGSSSVGTGGVDLLRAVGGTHARVYCMWGYLVPQLESVNETITVDWVNANPGYIDEYAATLDWTTCDNRMQDAADAGVQPILEVGEGTSYTSCLPTYTPTGTKAEPDVIGGDSYLGYQTLFVRAAVRRYADKVDLYQTENELNEACFEGFIGQRPLNMTGYWCDWDYTTSVLSTLRDAVLAEDPSAQTTMNFHTDVPKEFHTLTGIPGYYEDAVVDWEQYMDVMSFDAYPNYGWMAPDMAGILANRTQIIAGLAPGKDVFVMEAGISVLEVDDPQPSPLNFTQSVQADWITEAVQGVADAGGSGFLYFGLWNCSGIVPPEGGYTDEDATMMGYMGELYAGTVNYKKLVAWATTHIDYLMGRGITVIETLGGGFCLADENGNVREGLGALEKAFSAV